MRKGNAGIEPAGTECILRDMAGRWKSGGGEPDIRIYRSGERKNGGFFMEFAYKTGDVFRRPIRQYFGILYFDLYGLVKLAYDVEHDVLSLSGYGDFYREE
jgi:hypothetical protein